MIISVKYSGYTLHSRNTFGNYTKEEHLYKEMLLTVTDVCLCFCPNSAWTFSHVTKEYFWPELPSYLSIPGVLTKEVSLCCVDLSKKYLRKCQSPCSSIDTRKFIIGMHVS